MGFLKKKITGPIGQAIQKPISNIVPKPIREAGDATLFPFMALPYMTSDILNGEDPLKGLEDRLDNRVLGPIKDLLFGKEQPGTAPDPISADVRKAQKTAAALQEKGMDEYAKELSPSADARYDSEVNTEVEQGVRGLLKDRMKAGQVAQKGVSSRGLDQSSMGLSALADTDRAYGSNISALRSDIKNRVQNLKKARTEKGIDLASSTLAAQDVPIDFYGKKPERMGGVLPLLTGGVGAYFGSRDGEGKGGAGFQAGMGAGQYVQGYRG